MMTERRPAKLTKWQPKKWRPEYERIVQLSIAGYSNKAIAELTGYTKVHISSILNLDEADQIKEDYIAKLREKTSVDLTTRLAKIAEKTAERLEQLVNNDDKFEQSPFAIVDRGMEVIKGLGHFKKGDSSNPNGGGNVTVNMGILPSDITDRLVTGLEKANEARLLNAKNEGRQLAVIEAPNESGTG